MKKNLTLKCLFFLFFTFLKVQAQYYADGMLPTKTLVVDIEMPKGESPDGTIGSWYKWTINNNASVFSNPSPNAPIGSINSDSNKAEITWNATWPIAGGDHLDLIKDYTITAEEFNSCQATTSTIDSKTDVNVKLVKPDVLKIDADTDVCSTTVATFTLYGIPNGTVNYTLTGTSTPSGTATFDSNGQVDIQVTSDGSGDIILTIDKVTFTGMQPTTPPTSVTFENQSELAINSKTISLKEIPIISPIVF